MSDWPIIQTDDFASWEDPLDWYERMLEQVLIPLSRNDLARYQRYDWSERRLMDWKQVAPGGTVILEGVSSGREAFRPYLSYVIWVQTPRELRLERGVQRDGEAMREQWLQWMAAEDEYIERERPEQYADLVVSGVSSRPPLVDVVRSPSSRDQH